jgi:PAS domain S-box-containing protein
MDTDTPPIILVDDEQALAKSLAMALHLADLGYPIRSITDSREVLPLMEAEGCSVLVLDLGMPHIPGTELLPQVVKRFPNVPIIILTAVNDLETIVECMKAGAFDFIMKPTELSPFVALVGKALDAFRLKARVSHQAHSLELNKILLLEKEGRLDITRKMGQLTESLLYHISITEKLAKITQFAVDNFGMALSRIWLAKNGDMCQTRCNNVKVMGGMPDICRQEKRCLHLLAHSGDLRILDSGNDRRLPLGYAKVGRIAMGQDEKFISNNIRNDLQTQHKKWIQELNLISFAGFRLHNRDGNTVGVMSGFSEHTLDEEKIAHLSHLAQVASQAVVSDQDHLIAEERYKQIFENMPVSIFLVDTQGVVIDVNPFHVERVGLGRTTRQDYLNTNILEHPSIQSAKIVEEARQVLHGQSVDLREIYFPHSTGGGKDLYFNIRGTPVYQDGVLHGAVFTFDEITKYRQADEKILRFNRIFEASLNEIFIFDAETFLFIDVNRGAMENIGYSIEELRTMTPVDIKPNMTAEMFVERVEPLRTGVEEKLLFYTDHQRKDGTIYNAEIHLQLLADDRPIFMAIILDITERRQNEKKLKEYQNSLEYLVKERTSELQVAMHQLENTQKMVHLGSWEMNILDGTALWSKEMFEIVGRPYLSESSFAKAIEYMHPEDRDQVMESVEASIQQGSECIVEYRFVRPNGEERHIYSKGKITEWSDGKPSKMTGALQDITERKLAEEAMKQSESKFRTLFESTSDAVTLLENGRAVDCNKAAVELFGFPNREAAIQLGPEDVSPSTQPCGRKSSVMASEYIAKAIRDGIVFFEFVHCRYDDGELFHAEVLLNKLQVDNVTLLQAVVRNISKRKQMEYRLLQAKEQAEAATQAKSDFLSNMSHEIRTPMNAIMGMTSLCLKTELTDKQQDYLTNVHISTQYLMGVINDILDFSKIEAGKMEMEAVRFTLDEVLDRLVIIIQQKSREKGLELLFRINREIPVTLVGDSMRLLQVMTNLAGNAVKFTDTGQILISVQLLHWDDSLVTLEFSIQDSGIGMSKEQCCRLFQSFNQADSSTTRKYGGTGLGLAISKGLVEMMDGDIQVTSAPGEGSTFIFTARFGYDSTELKVPQLVIPQKMQDLRVMVMDDNTLSCDILVESLNVFSCNVSTVASVEEAIEALVAADGQNPFGLVTIDWRMAETGSLETAKRIKDHPQLTTPPHVILMTAADPKYIPDNAVGDHLDGVIFKPFTNSQLFNTMVEIFGGKPVVSGRSPIIPEVTGLRPIWGAKVLLVEDNEINRQLSQELLEQARMVVEVAVNGKEAVEKVVKGNYDCVLMDIQMPQMDGYEATRRVRADKRFTELPILAMTANAMVEDRDRALAAGMNDHIPKPIDPHQLFATLLQWVKSAEREVPERSMDTDCGRGGELDIPLSDLPGVDAKEGLARFRGNRKLYLSLICKFIVNHGRVAEEIQAALVVDERQKAGRLAHSFKGMAGTIGANGLFLDALALEEAIEQEHGEKTKTLLNRIADQLHQLTEVVPKPNPDDHAPTTLPSKFDHKVLISVYNQLRKRLSDSDPDLKEELRALVDILVGQGVEEHLDRLQRKISQYDFEVALGTLDKLAEMVGVVIDGKKQKNG